MRNERFVYGIRDVRKLRYAAGGRDGCTRRPGDGDGGGGGAWCRWCIMEETMSAAGDKIVEEHASKNNYRGNGRAGRAKTRSLQTLSGERQTRHCAGDGSFCQPPRTGTEHLYGGERVGRRCYSFTVSEATTADEITSSAVCELWPTVPCRRGGRGPGRRFREEERVSGLEE